MISKQITISEDQGAGYPLPELGDLGLRLGRGEPHLAVGGVVPGARALVLAGLVRAGWPGARTAGPQGMSGPLVVVPHVADAAELAAGLGLLAPQLRVGVVASEGASPYQGSEPPLAARLELVALLAAVHRQELDMIVAPARVLLAPIPEPAEIADQVLRLTSGAVLDTGDLAVALATAGYRRVDVVEEAGEFAVRGWVVDLHPGDEWGVRLELDDDLIDSIRYFDPSTQRTCGDAGNVFTLLPLDPFPAEPERLAVVADLLVKEYPGLAAQMREGSERRLWWGALHLGDPALTWLDLCDLLVVCDRDEVMGELARWGKVQHREWQTLARRQVALPPPQELLADPLSTGKRLEQPALRIDTLIIADHQTQWWRLETHPVESFARRIPDLAPSIRQRRAEDMAQLLVVASAGEERRFSHLLADGEVNLAPAPPAPGGVACVHGELQHGFIWDRGLVVYGRRDLTAAPPPRRTRKARGSFVSDLRDLRPDDLVVHTDHGIGRFSGFRRVEVEGQQLEMMVLTYHGGDSLLVPVERADLIQKYSSGSVGGGPRLDRLGGGTWGRRKARVKKAVREMAAELLRLAAARKAASGHPCAPDSPWQREFEDAFEHELTGDQERAVSEIKADMESERPMDRLLCGDVGYGKTEVALRAAFKAVLDGKQVAVLGPTTILVDQHLQTFRQRMAGFPIEIKMLSRFVKASEGKTILKGLSEGTVDIVIGTHRLISADVRFRDLGLVILDEEQRFGVAQKERLKRFRTQVDVLAMSATPIPRTLNMAFTGLRDISLIETPPRDRQAVETTVLEFSEEVVREAILYELERGGQVFFVHNRVRSIGAFAQWLRRAVPEARIVVAHGQMAERHLDKAMRSFLDGESDVLLATAIIENGLDISNANTLLVNRADHFGLAQLYQLRGRVGRSERLAFAYFLVPPGQTLRGNARARLAAVQEFCELGAGFRVAARDLEIRGAGNMLGGEQHGFLEAVGFETYCQLLDEAVAELEGRPVVGRREVELRLGLDVQLPGEYIPEPSLRLTFYKRLASCESDQAVTELLEEVVDRYGPAPSPLVSLGFGQRLRIAAMNAGVCSVMRRKEHWRLRLDPDVGSVSGLAAALSAWPGAKITRSGEVNLPDSGASGLEGIFGFLAGLGVE